MADPFRFKTPYVDAARERAEAEFDARQAAVDDALQNEWRTPVHEDEEGVGEPSEDIPTPATTPIPAVLDTDLNFISGQAGVGKTWMARALVAQRPGTLLCATTGIAATNLGEGTTINAALGYFDTASLQDSFVSGHLTARLGKLYRSGIRRLLIDEVSMMDGDQLTIITRALEELAGRKYTMNQALTDEVLRQQEEEGEDSTKVLPLKITLVADFCLAPETPVTLIDGTITTAAEIYPGAVLMGPDGQARTVVRTKSALGEMFRVDQTNGDAYTVNALHPVVLRRSLDGSRMSWGKTRGGAGYRYPKYPDEFTLPAQVLAQMPTKFRECFAGYKAGCLQLAARPVTIDPYFLGVWLGDGSRDRLRITTADPEIQTVCEGVAEQYGLHVQVRGYNGRTKAWDVSLTSQVRRGPNSLWDLFKAYDLPGNKHIPEDYLLNTPSVRLQLLAGLIDTDGCWSGNRYTFAATPSFLAKQVKQLADQLGFRTALRFQGQGWIVTIGGDTWRIPCRIARKKSTVRELGRSRMTSTLKVTPVGIGEYIGIETDGDHLFLLGDGTVVHNCQLPPVKAAFAFESPEWERYAAHTLKLTEIKRQSDRDFILALQAARRGDADTLCDYFGSRLHQQHDPQFPGSTIYGTNEAVDRFNQLRLDKVPGKQVVVKSSRWGKQRGDWKNIPETLALKEGALVMLLANQRDPLAPNPLRAKLIYANGDLAIITALTASGCYVKLRRNGREEVVEWVTRDNQIPLEPGRLAQLKAEDREDLIGTDTTGKPRWERVGGVTYLPLRIAYATTCHKAQGLTLDHVQVDTKEGMFKTPGLLYVALSRARTSEGLRLIGSVDGLRQRCTVDRRVVPYL